MTHFITVERFDQWRTEARRLVSAGVETADVSWTSEPQQPSLFETNSHRSVRTTPKGFTVPPRFLELAKTVACHRDPSRWEILYRVLWRLVNAERHLLELVTDADVYALTQMQKGVTRDVHKMKAFVRFKKVIGDHGQENFIAWHRPDHQILRLAAPFFARRFKAMDWTILTPDESVIWDQTELLYGPGVPASEAPSDDALEELWLTYYASIFNPARVKVATMKREMPVRHWPTLPEAAIIEDLVRDAPARVETMIDQTEGMSDTATRYMPSTRDLDSLREAAAVCRACPLHGPATQTVFGEGSSSANLMIVGEQPGDREDIVGRPFVGPSGELLNAALQASGIDRDGVYITNVVKHFKFVQPDDVPARGKHRLHKKPDAREIYACRPWLEAEITAVRPHTIVCLGATAAQSLLGRDFRITKDRGKMRATDWCDRTIASWHPAAILRMPDPARREQMKHQLASDLARARDWG